MIYSQLSDQPWNDSDMYHGGGYIAEYVVPEPGTFLLLGSGLLGLGIIGYRRRKKA